MTSAVLIPPTEQCRAAAAMFADALRRGDLAGVARSLHPSVTMSCLFEPEQLLGEYQVITALSRLGASAGGVVVTDVSGQCERPQIAFTATLDGVPVGGVMNLVIDELGLVDHLDMTLSQ